MSSEFEDLLRRIPEIERRLRNVVRYGRVAEVDPAKGLVRMIDEGGGEGQDYTSTWRPWAEVGGGIRTWRPPTVGQQVVMFSPSGNLADGIVFPAAFSDAAPQPSDKGDEIVETIGATTLKMRGDAVHLSSPTIVLDGDVHLGGEGGKPVHRKDDVDSAGDVAVTHATRVWAK